MKIEGTQTQKVTVDVAPEECLHALACYLGVGSLLYPAHSGFRYREVRANKGKGKLTALQPEHDISYHGRPCWQDCGSEITDETVIAAYEAVLALEKLI